MNRFIALWNAILDTLFAKSDLEQHFRDLTEVDILKKMRAIPRPDGTVSLFRIEDPLIREMIFALKYRKNNHVARLFAKALSSYVSTLHPTKAVLIPVPLSKKRRSERGFNQMELILSCMQTSDVHISTTLQKIRETKPQTTLHRHERLKNLKGAFSVRDPSEIRDKQVILIDDVTTTGSTLSEASKVLMDNGAKSVLRIAIAR